ncbi:phosphatase PAP2 family protein [Streptomyces sp. NBC_00080]|uniref:phosphatase PAP2 family protein n=2 Tax=Streptomyces TaxID=1883 RepID=UPI0006BB1648|nr:MULTISPECIES: phosphatase PAP2 family protein [Streptomyces]KPI30613.1 phosphoesterase PA-phosphatase related protein [Actinobacteria bacterium OV320]MCX5372219.1 phosphatase PAP2 family protein [Streptomyces sp. NBC_00103]TQJ57634.1 undecaprenyl-diphosphatase [Streptomyces sp. SLBN-115]
MSDRLPKLPTSHLVRDLATMDQALYETVTVTRTPTLDSALRRLSAAADHSKLSFGVAAGLALCGRRPRRAAVLGVAAIGVASATANLLGKKLVRRPRPHRAEDSPFPGRHVPMPQSASFPSGHTASAVAFAAAVGPTLPVSAVPLGLLACAVGYSRVHTGVHYPGDVVAGALLGTGSAALVLALTARKDA